ncbi:MAG: SufE family protein [Chloroflexota bacterium]|nr:SufE family protein [Chloroflexota bacterium]
MASIQEIQNSIVEDFSFLPEWDDRYAYLIELGQKIDPLPEQYRTEDNIVRGCQSTVWLYSECRGDKVYFKADSDSLIVKGLAALLMRVFSGQNAEQVSQADLTFFEETGLNKHLSSQRTNGLMAMIEKIQSFAFKCKNGEV